MLYKKILKNKSSNVVEQTYKINKYNCEMQILKDKIFRETEICTLFLILNSIICKIQINAI